MLYLLLKGVISGAVIVAVSELAKRSNWLASIVHSLPLTSLLAFIWIYTETKDDALLGRHAYGTFWFVLPTLPLFLLFPWLIQKLGGFWPALGVGVVGTVVLYAVTMWALNKAGVVL